MWPAKLAHFIIKQGKRPLHKNDTAYYAIKQLLVHKTVYNWFHAKGHCTKKLFTRN